MEDYTKTIESLSVRFIKANNINILQSVSIADFYDVENQLIILHKGEIQFGDNNEVVEEGDALFIPGGKNVKVAFGRGSTIKLNNDSFINNKESYIEKYDELTTDLKFESYSYVTFEAKVFDSVNFFASLDIPPFVIKSDGINLIMKQILRECVSNQPGKNRVIKLKTDNLVVEIIRYILSKRLFVEQLATNSTYFKDPRLIDIFAFIKNNLGGDLSNKVLASVANVSEDYVGQYFKMLTGINPQDYIEYQRMEEAVNLLRTTKKSIRAIGKEVGYKDTAYFCRRFKMMFGIPAGKMRRRESLMNL